MCLVGRLDRGESAVVKIRSRLWAQTFLRVSIAFTVTRNKKFHFLGVNVPAAALAVQEKKPKGLTDGAVGPFVRKVCPKTFRFDISVPLCQK